MKKIEAIDTINRQIGSPLLISKNTHFANVNSSKNVWWFDIPTSKAFSKSIPHRAHSHFPGFKKVYLLVQKA